jgi:hypothetical protein
MRSAPPDWAGKCASLYNRARIPAACLGDVAGRHDSFRL